MRNVLFITDPQNDFCDASRGSLSLPHAGEDCRTIRDMLERGVEFFDAVVVSMDMHTEQSVFHDVFWLENGKPVSGVGTIDRGNIDGFHPKNPAYEPFIPRDAIRRGRFGIDIWPVHCVIGTWGNAINDDVREALHGWSFATGKYVEYLFKGMNPFREEYSVFASNPDRIASLLLGDAASGGCREDTTVYFCGEAASHCVYYTIRDACGNLEPSDVGRVRFRLISNCASYVPGFEHTEKRYDEFDPAFFGCVRYDTVAHAIFEEKRK